MGDDIQVGDRVMLKGLTKTPELNGARGTLISFDDEVERWQVQLDGGGSKHVWAVNVVKLPPAKLKAEKKEPAQPGPPAKKRAGAARTAKAENPDPEDHRPAKAEQHEAPPAKRKMPDPDEGDDAVGEADAAMDGEQTTGPGVKAEGQEHADGADVDAGRRGVGRRGRRRAAVGGRGRGRGKGAGARGSGAGCVDDDKFVFVHEELGSEEELSDEGDDVDLEADHTGDIACAAWLPVDALPWPDAWSGNYSPPKQGEKGFNAYAGKCLARVGLGGEDSPFAGLGMRLPQESVSFLLHPSSPIQRLLVDHATGTGKTLTMLRVLDNFFDDPRPKLAVFPTDRACHNFYRELLRWPTRWRHYFAVCCPEHASRFSGVKDWWRRKDEVWDVNSGRLHAEARKQGVELDALVAGAVKSMKEALSLRGAVHMGRITPGLSRAFRKEHPSTPVPRAPLRTFRYTTAGGRACELSAEGWPRSSILQVGFDGKYLNPYSGKVLLLDECHHIVQPTQKYSEQIGRLRDHVRTARGSVVAGFTGSPMGNEVEDCRRLLDLIKGDEGSSLNDEGFVSSFHVRGRPDFPRENPVAGLPDGVIHEGMFKDLVKRHTLHGEALRRYFGKMVKFQGESQDAALPEEAVDARLAHYCNIYTHPSRFSFENVSIRKDAEASAPKLHAIAAALGRHTEKSVVMLARESAASALILFRHMAKAFSFRVAGLDELAEFNDAKRNLRGERFRALVVGFGEASDDAQFRHTRRLYLADLPLKNADLVREMSHCIRHGVHEELPAAERTLAVELHVAQLPRCLRQSPGPAALLWHKLVGSKEAMTSDGKALEAAVDVCVKELRRRNAATTLASLQAALQAEGGEKLIELLTESILEQLGNMSNGPVRRLLETLWRLRRGEEDLPALERTLADWTRTANERSLDRHVASGSKLVPLIQSLRLGAVDRELLAPQESPFPVPQPGAAAPQACEGQEQSAAVEGQAPGLPGRRGADAPVLEGPPVD